MKIMKTIVNSLHQTLQSFLKSVLIAILFFFFCLSLINNEVKGQSIQKKCDWESLKLVNSQPTDRKSFAQAFPIGNGRLGAKVFGGVASEVVCLNESTLWSGMPTHYEKSGTPEILALLRKALMDGDYKKGDELARQLEGKNNESYQPLGNLYLNFPNHDTYSNYRNTLDLDRAMVITKYTVAGVNYTREIFASYPDQVIVIKIYSSQKGSLTFNTRIDTKLQGKTKVSDNEMTVTGRAPAHVDIYSKVKEIVWDEHKGIGFESRLRLKTKGGRITSNDSTLFVANADTAVLLFSAANSFNGIDKNPVTEGKNASAIVKAYLDKAQNKDYQQLLQSHLKDYQGLFRRLWVDINGEKNNKYAMAYQWARYNLIACSRPGGGAMRNEQGIWNEDIFPHYASNYTLNENPQKYYTLAEPANIAEVTLPMIDYVGDLAKNGAITAKVNYGFKGWVAHHNSDIWAMTTMATGDPCWATWPMGGIWLCQNLWEHYAFGMDKNYLNTKAYPIMKGAAEFALDLLVKNKKGYLVTSPSTSPENHFFDAQDTRVAVSMGSTMDMALVKKLFQNCIAASKTLNTDKEFRTRLETTLPKLLPFQIGSQGQLMEWSEDFKEWEPTHRHASHLISVWPLSQITKDKTPEFFAAAQKSLELRKSGGYHPDKAGMWARLLNGDKALASLTTNFPVMYDTPFGGFAEMLLQSHTGFIDILPALPSMWGKGKILGIRARGNYEVDIEWENNQLKHAEIRSYSGQVPSVRVMGQPVSIKNNPKIAFTFINQGN